MVGNKPNPFPLPTHDTECEKGYGFVIERNCRAMLGFFGGSDGKESTCNAGDLGSIPGLGRFPWRRALQPTLVFLPGESPWTEVPGRPQSMGSQRVKHD